MNRLIQRLPDGPLDIIGDVHGFIGPLEQLLANLGYSGNAPHPDGRQLVFCGDLVDRGPDSPAVVERVMGLVAAGHAHCVLGNHELNALRGVHKEGNSWIIKPDEVDADQTPVPDEQTKARFVEFFSTLPLVLENDHLRVVHACWDPRSVELFRDAKGSVLEVYKYYEALTRERLEAGDLRQRTKREKNDLGAGLTDQSRSPPFYPHIAASDAIYQNGNPVRVSTSGKEEPVQRLPGELYSQPLLEPDEPPFFAGGKWRMVRRMKWWDDYRESVPVIFGHYWRNFGSLDLALVGKFAPDLFQGIAPHHWMGANQNVYCVDFSIGMGKARGQNKTSGHLAAVRFPEWRILHDEHEPGHAGIKMESNSQTG
ncbi:MAG: metallophosphoesterase [Gammaproteobacteria bacterium]|jgi:hypothetical protein|nr:metallophosphoesterase [Gammaproteobacteria bacterium]